MMYGTRIPGKPAPALGQQFGPMLQQAMAGGRMGMQPSMGRSFVDPSALQMLAQSGGAPAPPVAFPSMGQLPPNTSAPDVAYPGGMQNFWSNGGRTFNIPGAQALAQDRAQNPQPGPGPFLPSDWRDSAFSTGGGEKKEKRNWFDTMNSLDPAGIGGAINATKTLFDFF